MYTCIRRKIGSRLSRKSDKIKTSRMQHFCLFLDKMQRTSKGSDLSKKRMGLIVDIRELSTIIDIKIPTTTVFVNISYSARPLNA